MKINALLLFLVCLFLQSGKTQENNNSIDLVFGVDFSNRNLKLIEEGNSRSMSIIDLREGLERPSINFGRIGFNFNQLVSKQFILKTGLRYAKIGYETKEIMPIGINQWTTDNTLQQKWIRFKYQYHFLELPLMLRYKIGSKKLSPFIEAGISANYFIGTNTKSIDEFGKENGDFDELTEYHKIKLVGLIALGMDYILNTKYDLFFQINSRYHFTETVKADTPINENLYELGIEIGGRYKF